MNAFAGINGARSWSWNEHVGFCEWLVEQCPTGERICEVGALIGKSICKLGLMLKEAGKVVELTAVDLWCDRYENVAYGGYKAFVKNVKNCGLTVNTVRKDSSQAASDFPDHTFWIVLIDADHSYKGVAKDLAAWFPKVKRGGIFCGHDYGDPEHPGVAQAVAEWAERERKTIEIRDTFWSCRV